MRVITTGWRGWAGDHNVNRLQDTMEMIFDLVAMTGDRVMQILVGDAPGADAEVVKWWELMAPDAYPGLLPEPIVFKADWKALGSAAGPVRNSQMVVAGADLCVAFLHPESRGTRDCRAKAKRAKIWTLDVWWEDDPTIVAFPNREVVDVALPEAA